jgi:hypothetical protein
MENNDSSESFIRLDLEVIKNNLPQYTSTKLCEMIVCDRYFGFNQKIAVMCMEELAQRRLTGDIFDFETYIEESLKQLPVLNFKMPDLQNTLRQMASFNKKIK